MNTYLGHLREVDIKTVADAVRYCTYFSCQCNGCSIVVGIRNLWVMKSSYRIPENTDLTFTERLNELDEILYDVTNRKNWSTSKRWNCGNCVGNRFQYDVGNRHGYLKDHREALDGCIIEYSQDALKRFSGEMPVSFNHQEQVQEYKRMMDAIATCDQGHAILEISDFRPGCPSLVCRTFSSFQFCCWPDVKSRFPPMVHNHGWGNVIDTGTHRDIVITQLA